MISRSPFQRLIALLLALVMLGGSAYGLHYATDQSAVVSLGANFNPNTRWARVDESVGLRADASIGGARGITGYDTRIFSHRHSGDGVANIPAGLNPSLPISITPNQHYTLTGVTVVAFATIEHRNGMEGLNDGWGTREVVTDIRTWEMNHNFSAGAWTGAYVVPTEYFETFLQGPGGIDSRMEIEVVLYADLTYSDTLTPLYNIVIGAGDYLLINGTQHDWLGPLPAGLHWTAANGNLPAAGVYNPVIDRTPVATSNGRGLWIDAGNSVINGSVIRVIGMSEAIPSPDPVLQPALARGAWHILVEGNQTPARQTVHLILEDLQIFPGLGGSATGDFWSLRQGSNDFGTTMIQHYASMIGNTNRIADTLINNTFGTNLGGVNVVGGSGAGGNFANRAPLIFTNVDAFVTLRGDNILAHSDTRWSHPSTAAVHVDASASLVFTDASNGTLYARGGGCSSAIGSMHLPVGFIQIDGGHIIAESATSSHQFAGIGHGGHSENQVTPQQSTVRDPNLRGIVINGGIVEALGFHYGIGANGGTVAGYNQDIGPTYIILTGGEVAAESSAGSGGAAIGFAFNNDVHHVRIGRMDKDDADTVVTAVNWGFGAAISGNMTFYSGITTAYSGQYAAAIGGNAISWASTAVNVTSRARAATDAESGAPLTVYGGVVTVVAGAFPQRDLTVTAGGVQFDVNQARGVDSPFPTVNPLPAGTGIIRPVYPGGFASRIGAQDAVDAAFDPDVTGFGAGIGGAIRQDGGTRNHIFGGEFDITSSTHGAGIGGGGGSDAFLPLLPTPTPGVVGHGTGSTPGAGTWFGTHRVRMNESHTNLTNTGSLISMLFDIVSGEFGAGIGGGGSDGPLLRAGDGGNIFIGGGNFNIKSGEHGAGIGGGGSKHGAGGDGGNVVIAN